MGRPSAARIFLVNSLSIPPRWRTPPTDVGQPGEFQQALDGAVLAVGAVQDRENDVDRSQNLAEEGQSAGRLTGDGGEPSVGDHQVVGADVGAQPRTLRGDADCDDIETLRIQVTENAASRHTRDRMLGTAPAVDDGDADPGVSHKLKRLPSI